MPANLSHPGGPMIYAVNPWLPGNPAKGKRHQLLSDGERAQLAKISSIVRFKKGEPLKEKDVVEAIREGEARLGDKGRLVIRKSGTEPLIRVMGEGDDAALVKSVVNDIVSAIESHAA